MFYLKTLPLGVTFASLSRKSNQKDPSSKIAVIGEFEISLYENEEFSLPFHSAVVFWSVNG